MDVGKVSGRKSPIAPVAALFFCAALVGGCDTTSGKEDEPDVLGVWKAGEEKLQIMAGGKLGGGQVLKSLCGPESGGLTTVPETGGTWHYKEISDAGPGIEISLPDFFGPDRPCAVEFLIHESGETVERLTPVSGPVPADPLRRS
ncbi:hypothetical protein ACFV6F_26050 [Kitasatospora phosalacinea]|uniref:hypothetical protein n=1 Tax=Kitasatospora phosalacinea TaxID=2065 RepID=UPI003649F913